MKTIFKPDIYNTITIIIICTGFSTDYAIIISLNAINSDVWKDSP